MTFSYAIYGERALGTRYSLFLVRLYLDGRQVRPGWWRFSFSSAVRKGEKEARLANERYGRRVR